MNIFPYSLVRLGGESFEQWAKMNTESITQEVATIIQLKEDKKHHKEQLCEHLFSFIERLEDPSDQNLLQNLRRDLFNNRKIKNNKLNKSKEILSDELNQELEDYLQLNLTIKSKIQTCEDQYQKVLYQNREVFKQIANYDSLKKGLLLSSKSLLERLDSYTNREIKDFRKKEYQVEQGLLKYLTRMYMKTSPFSTFTNLSMAELTDKNESAISIKHTDEKKVKGHIRLNNYLLKYVLDLFVNYREAYLWLSLRPNPTIENKEDHFLFLTNNNNIESFQRIPYNPVVELIIETAKEDKSGIRFNELVTSLQDSIEADTEELESYVKQLVDYGCLEYNVGVSGIDPDWDVKLVEKLILLKEHNVPHISELIDVLTHLREMGDQYAQKDDKGRKEILSQAYDNFRAICMLIHEEAGLPEDERKTQEELQEERRKKQEEIKAKEKAENKDEQKEDGKEDEEKKEDEVFKHKTSTFFSFKPEQIFYEDTTREVSAVINQKQLDGFVERLDRLMQSLKVFKGMEDETIKMKHYFLQKYDEESTIDLLTFYEDFFREYKKPLKEYEEEKKKEAKEKAEKEKAEKKDEEENKEAKDKVEPEKKEEGKEENPFLDIPALKEKQKSIKEWNEKYTEIIKNTIKTDGDKINLVHQEVLETNKLLGIDDADSEGVSYGSFVQFYISDTGELEAVLNGTFAGFGKMLSRFLHIFDAEVTDTLRSWNNDLNVKDTIFIEDCDASYFNANLHPPLMPNEIWMPGGHNTLPEEQQIPITDFAICYDKKENDLILKHKPTGKESYVFNLGFQGSMGRSQLFQLLEKFSKAEYLFTQPVVNNLNTLLAKTEKEKNTEEKVMPKISVQPRIVYEDQITLQRKTWNVPKVLIPERQPIDTDWEYYLKINEWRLENEIPDEVFVFINPDRWGSNLDPKLAKKLTKDDYKPQYIDFRNPLLINLLEKLIAKTPVSMKVQEMLPASGQMLKIDNERFVSEFVVQWYK